MSLFYCYCIFAHFTSITVIVVIIVIYEWYVLLSFFLSLSSARYCGNSYIPTDRIKKKQNRQCLASVVSSSPNQRSNFNACFAAFLSFSEPCCPPAPDFDPFIVPSDSAVIVCLEQKFAGAVVNCFYYSTKGLIRIRDETPRIQPRHHITSCVWWSTSSKRQTDEKEDRQTKHKKLRHWPFWHFDPHACYMQVGWIHMAWS